MLRDVLLLETAPLSPLACKVGCDTLKHNTFDPLPCFGDNKSSHGTSFQESLSARLVAYEKQHSKHSVFFTAPSFERLVKGTNHQERDLGGTSIGASGKSGRIRGMVSGTSIAAQVCGSLVCPVAFTCM